MRILQGRTYLKGNKSGIALIFILVLMAVATAVFLLIIFSDQPTNPDSIVTVTASLKPSTVKEQESATLKLKFENNDLDHHQISCVFETSFRVSFYAGNQLISDKTYSLTIDAGDPAEERELTVKGYLEEGVSTADYIINLSLYVDGNSVSQESQKITLTVIKS